MSSKVSWGCCADASDEEEHLLCVGCKFAFHMDCVKVDPSKRNSGWKCLKCSSRKPRKDDSPVRFTSEWNRSSPSENTTKRSAKRQAPNSPASQEIVSPLTRDDLCEVVNGVFDSKMKDLVSQICISVTNTFKDELKCIRSEISELKDSMQFINNQYDEFMGQHSTTVEEVNSLRTENINMRTQISNLNGRIVQLEQQSRANNVEIQCVPETKDENPIAIVLKLAEHLKCNITEDNIVKCTRIAKLDRSNPRPRSIVIQMTSPKFRDALLASSIKYNKSNPNDKLNSTHIGLSRNKSPIFVCEHLSPANKALHAAVRNRAKAMNYKYVWVRNGRVFVRKDDDTDYKIIGDMDALEKIK